MLIHVTQSQIDSSLRILGRPGTFNDKFHDPVTAAIRTALEAKRVVTHPCYAEVDGVWYQLPKEVTDWCNDWCKGTIGKPFSFNIKKLD